MKLIEFIKEKTKLDKKVIVIMLIGLTGIILLVVSELIPSGEQADETEQQQVNDPVSYETYAEDVETRLEELISSIQGAGKTKVMVTLDCSDENVYATDEKGSDSSYEDNLVIIETQDGESGVLIKVTQPKIRGVAVVCTGGASPTVRQSIIDTVTAVLDISSARVSIATMKTDNGG